MNSAVAAGGLPFLERTVFEPFKRIEQQLVAFRAEVPGLFMFGMAILADHDLNGLSLPPHSSVFPHISSDRWIEEFYPFL